MDNKKALSFKSKTSLSNFALDVFPGEAEYVTGSIYVITVRMSEG